MRYGKTALQEEDVAKILPGKTLNERYQESRAKLPFTDVQGHWELAQWCKKNKLRKQCDAQLEHVLTVMPDHAEAHRALGHIKVGKKWLPRRVAMKALGYQFHQGKWYRPDQLRELRKKQALSQRSKWLQQAINQFVRAMALKNDKNRKEARDGLVALAKREGVPQLVEVAGKLYQRYQQFWDQHRHVKVEVRATNAQLQGLDLIPTSIASGNAATGTIFIEAPRLTMSKANSTVIVPAGGGR
jgi:hypothetical protein